MELEVENMRKLSVLVLVILLSTASAVQADSYSRKVEVLSFEIRGGTIELGENTMYVFEGDEYKIEATLRLPKVGDRKMILYSNLDGRIHVECQDARPEPQFRSFDISEFAGEDVIIQLLGDPGYALESRGPRVITGEVKDFRFFRICIDGVETEIVFEDQKKFTLTTEEIFNARCKLAEVKQALSELESSSASDLTALKSVRTRTDQVRQLMALAERCISEGAPEEAIDLANICKEILLSSVLEDQITFFNSFIDGIPVDKAKATDHSHKASIASIEAERTSSMNDYIGYMNEALEELNKAEISITDSICDALKWQKYFLIAAVIELVFIIGLVFVLLRRKKGLGPDPKELFGRGD
jgi:hypothetical protein